MKKIRTLLGALLVAAGIIFSILPGSILFLLAGLMMLSVDYPKARSALAWTQRKAAAGARTLDRMLWRRRYK